MTTDITELAQREKFEAWVMTQICISKSTLEGLRTSVGYRNSTLSGSDYNLMWNLWKAAGAEMVEALEKAQAAERRWHRAASRIHEQACESDVKIDELEAIRAAAEKLVRCKGRYHSEQNYRALAALFGVNTPDLPPLDDESHAVTVENLQESAYRAGLTAGWNLGLANNNEGFNKCLAAHAAGIKVEAQ